MADNDFRSPRNRAPAGASPRAPIDDPLAELARLIGQSDPGEEYRDAGDGEADDDAVPEAGMDWAADDSYDAPPREHGDEPPLSRQLPRPEPRFNDTRDDPQDYAPANAQRYRDEPEPAAYGRQLPAFLPRARDVRYQYDDAEHDAGDEQTYALEDYDEEAESPRRRSGFVIVAAVLGLAVLGTAGAFAYRAMFGGSMLPSLPPIIKAEDGPTKIMPNVGDAHGAATKQADASAAGSGEKLVSREEKPVDVPAPVTTAPRVISTIPIFPAPTPGAPGAPPLSAPMPNVLGPVAQANPAGPAAPLPAMPAPAAPGLGVSDGNIAPIAAANPAASALPGSKKVHTVLIRPDQPGTAPDAAAAPPPAPARPAAAAASRPTAAMAAPRPSASPPARPSPAPQGGGNAPLAIVPPQGDAAPPAPVHPRTALARPSALAPAAAASEPAAASGGGYAVQVTSQRSEAEAQAAFRALAAKYPDQLGGHAPIVRRADLGAKGIYYRALVGPYASMEQAAGVCSSLKAAGGTCIVQKN